MPTVEIYNDQGEQVGELKLSETVFAAPVNEGLLYDVTRMQLSNRRLGTANTKTRAEVRGGGRKPWRQKGTGRARHGSIRSPIWEGGGVVFGPKPRSYRYSLPRKAKRAALRSALTARLQENALTVLDKLELPEPKTREMAKILQNLNAGGKVLLVTAEPDSVIYRSSRNIPGLKTALAAQINVLDLLDCDRIVITRDAVARVEEVFAS